MSSDNFINNYNRLASFVDNSVECFINDQGQLFDAMRYSLMSGGKRFRPVLTLAVAEMLNLNVEDVLPYSLGIECIHTASLIHDDLPALDNDALRRGKLTCHKVFGEAVAILAADAFFGKAFEVILQCETINPRIRSELCALLSKTLVELCVGQALEFETGEVEVGEGTLSTENDNRLRRVDLKKTSALISAACAGPALFLTEEKEHTVQALIEFGNHLGLLFQITDDILDACSEASDKPTYVNVFGLNKAQELALQEQDNALKSLDKLNFKTWFLKEICSYVISRRD